VVENSLGLRVVFLMKDEVVDEPEDAEDAEVEAPVLEDEAEMEVEVSVARLEPGEVVVLVLVLEVDEVGIFSKVSVLNHVQIKCIMINEIFVLIAISLKLEPANGLITQKVLVLSNLIGVTVIYLFINQYWGLMKLKNLFQMHVWNIQPVWKMVDLWQMLS